MIHEVVAILCFKKKFWKIVVRFHRIGLPLNSTDWFELNGPCAPSLAAFRVCSFGVQLVPVTN